MVSAHLGVVAVDDALLGHATGCLLDLQLCSPVDLILVEKKCEWVIACSLHALTSIHERLFHSFGTYVNRLATTASSTRAHRES